MNQDVLIIGGGVIGLSIARELHRKGVRQVTIVDRGLLGGEASWAAAGMLAPNIETDTRNDFHRFGIESLGLYPSFAAELFEETGIDIELDRSGTMYLSFDEREEVALRETFARQQSRGVHVELLSGDRVRALEPSVSAAVGAGLLYPDDWQVENRKLLTALRRFAEVNGIRIVENAEVSALSEAGGRITGAKTSAGEFESEATVLATGAWTSLIKIGDALFPLDVKPIRGQMVSFQTGSRLLRHVVYSSTGYLVPRADGRLLVGATVEDVGFEKAVTEEGLVSLVLASLEILPSLGPLQIADQWSGLRPFVADGLPVIGDVPGYENLFVATAHYRNGILLAPMTGRIMADRIVDDSGSPFLESFGARRFADAAVSGSY